MAGLFLDQGEEFLLKLLLDQGVVLRLFTNNYTPIDASTENNFVEANFSGYAAKTFNNANDWTITPGAPTTAELAIQTFEANNNLVPEVYIYGYWFSLASNNLALWAEKFVDSNNNNNIDPRMLLINGDYIKILPKLNLKKEGE